MYKYLISLILITFSISAHSANLTWDNLSSTNTYQLNKELVLTDDVNTINLPAGSKLKLIERTSMGMIKVELYKFDISGPCTDSSITTDIQLLEVLQSNGQTATVGLDIAEDCVLEVFVEFVDLKTASVFN